MNEKNTETKTSADKSLTQSGKDKESREIYYVLASVFIISVIYFFRYANYIFFFQENQSLFIYSTEYLHKFAVKPGGLLEYAGHFLTQFYFNNILASIILSFIFILIAAVYIKINKRLSPDGTYSIPLIIIPACLLILIQSNINWLIHHNIGVLITGLYFWLSIFSDKKYVKIAALAFFPVFFYFAGAYAWIYFLMYILYNLIYEKRVYSLILLIIAGISFIVFKEVLFLQPASGLMIYHLPSTQYFKVPVFFFLMSGLIISFPVLIKICYSIKLKKALSGFIVKYASRIILILTIAGLAIFYNPENIKLFKLEKYLFRMEWDKLIKYQEAIKSTNIIAQYYYNLALAEKGLLCERMFFGPQNFGPGSLLNPWDSRENINVIFRGLYFFYTIGLINEAHRWAFESMVVQGYRPENLKMLIKTDLINGNYKVANKYISVLKKTLHYRTWAKKYEAMLDNPDMIRADPELGEKIKIQPQGDFPIRIKNPQTNVLLMLETNPNHKKAFEYKVAWYLLEKNVGMVVNEIKKLKGMGYTHIPRHMEEAAQAYAVNVGPVPDLGGMEISKETINRYSQYESVVMTYSSGKSTVRKGSFPAGINTYWMYLDFK